MTVMAKVHKSDNKTQKKRLKIAKSGKKEFKPVGKRGRLVVRNLPFKCSENEVYKHFKPFGEIKDIHLLRRKDRKLVGCGFVEFTSRLNADKAVEQLSGKPFLGRPIYIERAVARENYDEMSKSEGNEISTDEVLMEVGPNSVGYKTEIKEEPMSEDEVNIDALEVKHEELSSDEDENQTENRIEKLQNKEETEKNLTILKKARLIVRNLSFKTTEEQLKAHFSQFGEVVDTKLLLRPDGRLVGCGFVQFTKKQGAAKAIHYTSGKPFLGRPIIVDWAVPKEKFNKMKEEVLKKEIKSEEVSDEMIKPVETGSISVKKEEESEEETEGESDNESSVDSEENDGSNDDDEEKDSDDDTANDGNEDLSKIKLEAQENRRQRHEDVEEGKTVFVKNLPFSVTDEEFKKCMEQYGPVFYAIICKDKFTEHSKGSGFVKFKKKEDADTCLSAGTELALKGSILDPHPALKRTEVQQMKDKSKEKKDNRNLYLVKEGIIIAGTPAAQGVSVSDMERRLELEQWKTTRLRNLNMFVSRNRLVIHNLPQTFNDKQLRKLFQNHAGPKAVIKESRVMRNLKQVDSKGVGISKGFGFVSFEKHEDALKALRSINNNPTIFTPMKRPIVAFSIENRTILNNKTKKIIQSRQKNPLCKDFKAEGTDTFGKRPKPKSNASQQEENEPEYAGIVAKPGMTVKMRQKYKLKNQAQQHIQDVKKQKREIKMSRKVRRSEYIKRKQVEKKSTKQKKNNAEKDNTFTKLVDKYKTKILLQSNEKKKWYDR